MNRLTKIIFSFVLVAVLGVATSCGFANKILGVDTESIVTSTEESVSETSTETTETEESTQEKDTTEEKSEEKTSEDAEETQSDEKQMNLNISMGDIITTAQNGLNPGDTADFKVSVSSGDVTWLLSGNSSQNTIINSNGKMTVAWDEESKEITVTAVSNENINVNVAVKIEIIHPEPETTTEESSETVPPETEPIETAPPETEPPETQPPETQPPETQPPETRPPETQPPETKHKHSYESRVVRVADCANEGKILYSCSCGDYYYETIPATNEHKYTTVTIKPTCTEGGYTLHRCTVCYDSYKTDETPSLGGHVPVTSIDQNGNVVTTCSRCHQTLK